MTPESRPVIAEVVSTIAEYEREAEERWQLSICVWCGQPFGADTYGARFCDLDGCGHAHDDLPEPSESFQRSRCAYAAQRLRQRLQREAGRPRKAA